MKKLFVMILMKRMFLKLHWNSQEETTMFTAEEAKEPAEKVDSGKETGSNGSEEKAV